MTITLNISPEQEELILQRAGKANLTPEQYLLSLAVGLKPKRSERKKPPAFQPAWGAGVLAELEAEGVLTGYGDPSVDSPDLARQLRARFSRRGNGSRTSLRLPRRCRIA